MTDPDDNGAGLPAVPVETGAVPVGPAGTPRPTAEQLAALDEVEALLDTRWPETKIEPTLARIAALLDLLGSPERAYRAVHVAGTNGKTSVTRMVDALLTAMDLRVGRTTSPHLQSVTERIAIDSAPISPRRYVETYRDIAPYVEMVDASSEAGGGPKMSKFEVLTAMAYAAYADAPVDVAVVETGLGGSWDATNVIEADVAVITPIGIDHVEYLGSEITGIAAEKAGIIKPGAVAILAEQTPEVTEVLLRRAVEVDAVVARAGSEFAVRERAVAIGGQMVTVQGLGGLYEDVFIPLHGAHQADNAALAIAAVEALIGAGKDRALPVELVREAFAGLVNPGRLERVGADPTVLIDGAHNPHGATALVRALREEFSFDRLIGVIAVMGDKDVDAILEVLEPALAAVVVTVNDSPRCLPANELADRARAVFGEDRVHLAADLPGAMAAARTLAADAAESDDDTAGTGILVTGSIVTAGQARTLVGKEPM